MVSYERKTLDNGLRVVVSQTVNSPFAYMSVLYNVGSKHENSEKTGLAHLFEHLMFSGTQQVPDFDEPLQRAGGENNAFTNADYTHFYDFAPVENLDLMLFLEADRMQNVLLTSTNVKKEKQIVIEEFYETCLNMPYGDVWHHLYPMAFEKHPYAWPTIGKSPDQIQALELDEVQSFYKQFYHPGNAVLSIVSPLPTNEVFKKVDQFFKDIPARQQAPVRLHKEPEQHQFKSKSITSKVPYEAIYWAFHIPERLHPMYRVADIYTDILSGGRSSRFYENLYKQTDLFAEVDAYITGNIEPGLLIVEAKLSDESNMEEAEALVWKELQAPIEEGIEQITLDTFLALAESNMLFSNTQGLNTAIQLAYFEHCGQLELINMELDLYRSITGEEVMKFIRTYIQKDKLSILYVHNE